MGKKNGGREQSDLEWAMLYLWDRITSTVRMTCLLQTLPNTFDLYRLHLIVKVLQLGSLASVRMVRPFSCTMRNVDGIVQKQIISLQGRRTPTTTSRFSRKLDSRCVPYTCPYYADNRYRPLMPDLHRLLEQIKPNKTLNGDGKRIFRSIGTSY